MILLVWSCLLKLPLFLWAQIPWDPLGAPSPKPHVSNKPDSFPADVSIFSIFSFIEGTDFTGECILASEANAGSLESSQRPKSSTPARKEQGDLVWQGRVWHTLQLTFLHSPLPPCPHIVHLTASAPICLQGWVLLWGESFEVSATPPPCGGTPLIINSITIPVCAEHCLGAPGEWGLEKRALLYSLPLASGAVCWPGLLPGLCPLHEVLLSLC